MYLLVREIWTDPQETACVAWTGSGWSRDPCEALRLASPGDWIAYHAAHAVDGDVVSAQMVLGAHMGTLRSRETTL